jgi:hypothetical protein
MVVNEPISAEQAGPINLSLNVPVGSIEVIGEEIDVAEVTLRPLIEDDQVAIDMIKAARVSHTGRALFVEVPQPPGGASNVHSVIAGNVTDVIMCGNITGGVIVSGNNNITIGGRQMVNAVSIGSGGAVVAVARVPFGSSVQVQTLSADARVRTTPFPGENRLASVDVRSTSGDLQVEGVDRVRAQTISGDITSRGATLLRVKSTSGDVRAEGSRGNVEVKTISGDIDVYCLTSLNVVANSVSGDINVNSSGEARPTVSARSISGDVRTR